jgi:hypothetical protein
MTARLSLSAIRTLFLLLLLPPLLAADAEVQTATDPEIPPVSRERAIELYDAARYAEARELLEQLDGQKKLDGPLLYRLFYCQRAAGDAVATETLSRAIQRLEQEAASSNDLEAPFYLVNAYASLNRTADLERVAASATTRIENGQLSPPTTAMDRFRLGKLYADQERSVEAEQWYAEALDSFAEQGEAASVAYVRWAALYLAQATFDREDFVEAERYFSILLETEEPTMADLDRLAVIRSRLGLYAEAAQLWRRAERLAPAQANRARYCYRLVEAAASLEDLSAATPDGRLWTQLTKEQLEAILQQQVAEVQAVKQEAADSAPLDKEQSGRLQARLDALRPIFVGAALEYALQGHSIREAAFFGGYAPLIFKAKEWQLPRR